jgi:hypothetical protein
MLGAEGLIPVAPLQRMSRSPWNFGGGSPE